MTVLLPGRLNGFEFVATPSSWEAKRYVLSREQTMTMMGHLVAVKVFTLCLSFDLIFIILLPEKSRQSLKSEKCNLCSFCFWI